MYHLCVFANKIYLEALCRSPRWVNCRKWCPLQIGGRKWCPRDIPVADTGGLMYIDEEEQTLHYVHQSVKNHLFDSSLQRDGFCTAELDLHLGLLVLTYLNFSDFKRSLVKPSPESKTSFRPVDIPASSLRDPGVWSMLNE